MGSLGNNGSHSRKKITSGKKGKTGGAGDGVFGSGQNDMNKKVKNYDIRFIQSILDIFLQALNHAENNIFFVLG